MSFEELEKIIKDNGYDISFLNKQLIDELMEKGTIAKISTIFNSIKNNKLDFLIDDKKNAKLLVQYLLHSEPEMISKTCDYLKAHGILNERYVKAYKSLFFQANTQPSDSVSDDIEVQKATHKYQHTKDSDDVKIVGRHNDFFKNIEILKILGYDDDSELIENNVKLLTMSNKAVLRHVKELQLYDYPIGSDTFPLSAINASRIMELSDRFIELGEENYILRYASRLLAYVDGTLERLYALKAKGLPYHTKYGNEDKLLSYVTNLKLSCHLTQEQIDEAIPKDVDILLNGNKYSNLLNSQLPATISDETLADSMIENIENRYKETNWHYNFNGVIISRKKLLRNYEFLKNTEMLTDEEKNPNQMLFVSAINNSTLNSEQIEKVSNALMDKLEIGGNNGISKK